MFFTLRESATGSLAASRDPRINGSLLLLFPGVFILLIHYICFSDLDLWRTKGVICGWKGTLG